jgi:mono/diheme cytochrome c family protein
MGCAILGIGMGSSAAERERAPSEAQVAAARQHIAAGGAEVRRGRALFTDEGCDRCHALAAIGAGGKLGPRLDTLDRDRDDNLESVAKPREDTTDGYPATLMPRYGHLLDDADLQALAAFVTTASGEGATDGDEDDGGKRGRRQGGGREGAPRGPAAGRVQRRRRAGRRARGRATVADAATWTGTTVARKAGGEPSPAGS